MVLIWIFNRLYTYWVWCVAKPRGNEFGVFPDSCCIELSTCLNPYKLGLMIRQTHVTLSSVHG